MDFDPAALSRLRESYHETVFAFLTTTGATVEEAHETVDSLWGDLMANGENGRIRLTRYCGESSLQTWLNTVALNALLTRKRVDGRREARFVAQESTGEEDDETSMAEASVEVARPEAPLLDLMRDAVEFAFRNCRGEEFVLLQLEYCDRLERDELARMFGCSKPTISRLLEGARVKIAGATLDYLRQHDPWLEIKWNDFLELCRAATPACFGLGD